MGREILGAPAARRAALLNAAVAHWRRVGFPFPVLSDVERQQEFRLVSRLCPNDLIRYGTIASSTIGLRLANSFHPDLWSVPAGRHRRAPLDHFENDPTLKLLLSRAPKFWPDRRCWNAQCVRGLFRIYGGGRVSNFRPAAARALIANHSGDGSRVVDFSAGFGGRLLGCMTLNRSYLGIEPASRQLVGLRAMSRSLAKFSSAQVELRKGCAEDILRTLPCRSADLVISSPPYFKTEKYSRESSQSYCRYPTYEEWKYQFLSEIIRCSHRLLDRRGLLIMNVANTPRHHIASDVATLAKPFFRTLKTLKLLMRSRPTQVSSSYRWEPVFIFGKR